MKAVLMRTGPYTVTVTEYHTACDLSATALPLRLCLYLLRASSLRSLGLWLGRCCKFT